MDTRREHGQYWPGNRTDAGGETPAGTDNGKVDRVDLGTLPADATASEMRTAIRNIQNAMRPLATALAAALCGFAMAQTAPWDALRGGVHVVTNEQDAVAMAEIARATNGIPAQIVAATNDIPAQIAAATNGIPTEIAAATNGLPERIDAVTNGLSAYALKTQIPDMPDLSPYALKSEVPPAPDLTGYATKYEVALATNDIPERIAAATNGLPEKIESATNELHRSFAHTISATATALQPSATNGLPELIWAAFESVESALGEATNYTDEVKANLVGRIEQISLAFASSNTATRLATPEGATYQDATGVLWRAATSTGPSEWYFVSITYTNGTTIATNEIPGISSWSIDGEYDSNEPPEWTWHLRVPSGGIEYASLNDPGETSPSQMSLTFLLGGDVFSLEFARTNAVSRYWTPVDKVIYSSEENALISTKQDALPYPTNAIPFAAIADAPSGLTTNDVCNIVTNETARYTSWTLSTNGVIFATDIEFEYEEGEGFILGQYYFGDGQQCVFDQNIGNHPEDTLTFRESAGMGGADQEPEDLWYVNVTATRTRLTRNALGLARLIDLPPLTNGLATAASLASLSSKLSQASQDATNYTDTATNSLLTSLAPIISSAYTALQPSATNNLLSKTGGTIYDGPIDGGQLDVGSSNGYFGRININGAITELNVNGTSVAMGGAYVTIGGTGVVSVLTVGGTNVMDRIGEIESGVVAVAQSATNYTDSAIASTDTSYPRVIGITNVNQTVQYVAIDSAVPSTLSIMLPTTGDTKDWIVYVTAQTNVAISLPAATWWLADTSATNDIAPQTPTALYFSQAADGIYTLGRQEFTEVVLP